MLNAYCWPQSAKAGETVDIMISGDHGSCAVEVIRVGAQESTVAQFEHLAVDEQPIPDDIATDGCSWSPTETVTVDPAWRTGFYLVRATSPGCESAEAFFVVKASEPGDAILVLSTSTWAAYNDWHAPSFYTGGHVSSLLRPLPSGFLVKEDPHRYRAARFKDMAPDERRDHFATHSYWSSAAGWANWERLFVVWAENNGIEFDYATSLDLADDPELLDPYRLYLSIGHDEYWSASMRDSVEGWVDGGGAAVFLSGNTAFWQIRIEADSTRTVGYKFDFEQDPVVGTESETSVSTMWSDPLCRRPENQMTGVSFTRGGYANMPNSPAGGGYTVHRPDHWVFQGLDLSAGDVVGADHGVVGYECDGCEMKSVDGQLVPTGAGGTPSNFEILATAKAKLWETHEIPGALSDEYVGELNWVAERLDGADNQQNRDRYEDGAAVMGSYPRGDGWVFTTGCTDWAYGLDDETVSGITRNLIRAALNRGA